MTGGDRRALRICLGREAARRIAAEGWSPDLFDLLLGASGGAKWLVLGHLDRLLFGEFLAAGSRPLATLGSSIGSWRHACLAQPDPVAAIERMQEGYLNQRYSERPTAAEVSRVSRGILDRVLGDDGAGHIAEHPRIHTHIVTARGRGPAGAPSGALLAGAMGSAAIGNTVSRHLLKLHFQRVIFHSAGAPDPALRLGDFATHYGSLDRGNVHAALIASGSIPFVLAGERDIPGAPAGQYWDGGIIDYHFDLRQYAGEGLILYPHFGSKLFPGWFDKFLPWRSRNPDQFDRLVLLCPTESFIAGLPHGKIPDRSDFRRFSHEARIGYWEACIDRSRELAEDFAALLASQDPLAGAVIVN